MSLSWMADRNQIPYLPPSVVEARCGFADGRLTGLSDTERTGRTKVDAIIYLVAHKSPTLNVLKISLNGDNTSSLWFDGGGRGTELACLGQ
jgi:hypothetical protein